MKSCIYHKVYGGTSCERCTEKTTRATVKKRLKQAILNNDTHMINIYKQQLKP